MRGSLHARGAAQTLLFGDDGGCRRARGCSAVAIERHAFEALLAARPAEIDRLFAGLVDRIAVVAEAARRIRQDATARCAQCEVWRAHPRVILGCTAIQARVADRDSAALKR